MQSLLLTALRLVTVSAEWREKANEVLQEAKNGEKEPSNLEVRESLCQDVSPLSMPTDDAYNGKTQGAAEEEISVFALHFFSHYLMIPRKFCRGWSNSPPGKMQALPQAVSVNTDHNGSLFKHTRMVSYTKPVTRHHPACGK